MNFIKVHNINESKILKKEIWEEKRKGYIMFLQGMYTKGRCNIKCKNK
ncbi:MAG: hypothetical protein ACLS9F_00070 [Clostridium paraputrificum]